MHNEYIGSAGLVVQLKGRCLARGVPDAQILVGLRRSVRKAGPAPVWKGRRGGRSDYLIHLRGPALGDLELAKVGDDVKHPVPALPQIDRVYALRCEGSHHSLCSGDRIVEYDVRHRLPDETPYPPVQPDERVVVHVHVVHATMAGEHAGTWIVFGEIRCGIAANPDMPCGVLVHSAREGGRFWVDGAQVFQDARPEVEPKKVPGIGRADVQLAIATQQCGRGVVGSGDG